MAGVVRTVNNFKIYRIGRNRYSTDFTFLSDTGGYPTCPNKRGFHRLGFFREGCADHMEIDILEHHRGMNDASYFHRTIMNFTFAGDGIYMRWRNEGVASRKGIVLPGSTNISNGTNTRTHYSALDFGNTSGFTSAPIYESATLAEIGSTSWEYLALQLFTTPNCGADKYYVCKFDWTGTTDGFTPYMNSAYTASTNAVTSIVQSSDSAVYDIVRTTLP